MFVYKNLYPKGQTEIVGRNLKSSAYFFIVPDLSAFESWKVFYCFLSLCFNCSCYPFLYTPYYLELLSGITITCIPLSVRIKCEDQIPLSNETYQVSKSIYKFSINFSKLLFPRGKVRTKRNGFFKIYLFDGVMWASRNGWGRGEVVRVAGRVEILKQTPDWAQPDDPEIMT